MVDGDIRSFVEDDKQWIQAIGFLGGRLIGIYSHAEEFNSEPTRARRGVEKQSNQ